MVNGGDSWDSPDPMRVITSGTLSILPKHNRKNSKREDRVPMPEIHLVQLIWVYRYFKRQKIVYNPDELNSVLNLKKIRKLAENMRFDLFERSIYFAQFSTLSPWILLNSFGLLVTSVTGMLFA